jgi:uncharacterized membrane protein
MEQVLFASITLRTTAAKEVLRDELGELSELDHEVVESLREHEIISSNVEQQFQRELTFGERVSDWLAEFGGSWRFLMTFCGVLIARL